MNSGILKMYQFNNKFNIITIFIILDILCKL
jgi:hypothetical protein